VETTKILLFSLLSEGFAKIVQLTISLRILVFLFIGAKAKEGGGEVRALLHDSGLRDS
jgi:hypothetical protein